MLSSTVRSLVLSYIAAIGTSIGGLVIMIFPNLDFKQLGVLAGLAAGLMLSMIFFDLIPEALESLDFVITNVCFFAGIVFFAVILKVVPEQSLEGLLLKGGASVAEQPTSPAPKKKEYKKILLAGMVTALGITLHNFPEGLAIFLASKKSSRLGITLTAAMTLHNIPEGVAVALPIYFATKSKWEALKITTLSGLTEPLAVIFAAIFFPTSISQHAVDAMLAGVAGIMAFLAFHELLPMAVKHAGFEPMVTSVFVGMALMSICLAITNSVINEVDAVDKAA